jgi:RimJ/RimL family protein N-acetyltransferase
VNVKIRIARKGDAKGVVACWNDALNKGHLKYTGTNTRRGKADIKRFEDSYTKTNSFTFVAITDKGEIVGVSSLSCNTRGRTRHRGGLGWTVHPAYSRRGIGTKLVRAVLREAKRRKFKKVEAEVATENAASVQLAKKLRFKIEGRKKAGLLLDNGRYADTYLFGKILKP